ncbi:2'-5' RNA ligase superfamily protein [Micromonospora rhizosphaerae]|uniref:2'-5' RNA ligase superfamily protein n=1 Tax=Micromonospora rhizosphaerae TaxID=568872 RepID=A0A1C6RKT0_9ACTN|nr:2'-5' RNA ligase family protein [Micromonospora rhizosphaerae]SCL17787.1 2'-5' RNA ligase superfamily protein [Micromonospora rhizosphaerae]
MSFEAGQTAIIVAVPEAGHLVDRWRQLYDSSAPLGVPAHVTILYPFLEIGRIDESVVEQLRQLFARQPAVQVKFHRCGRFPDVLYLEPEPADTFKSLTASIVEHWPEAPPYGGAHDEVVPHLTVAGGIDEETLALIEGDVAARLPVQAAVTEARLIAFDGSQWATRTRFPFARR